MTRYCFVFLVLACFVLSGCQSPSRYSQARDSAPSNAYPEPAMEDVIPKYEPYRKSNSRPYEVFGKRYTPLNSGKGYTAVGNASWYGQKFHGHLTSNGDLRLNNMIAGTKRIALRVHKGNYPLFLVILH